MKQKNKTMGLLDNYSGIGFCARPKITHQQVIRNFLRNCIELDQQGFNPVSEYTVTNNLNDLAPDIIAFDENEYPRLMIEITTRRQRWQIMNKFRALIQRFPQAECWTFNYENNELFFYNAETQTWISSNEYELYSQYLSREMIEYFATWI